MQDAKSIILFELNTGYSQEFSITQPQSKVFQVKEGEIIKLNISINAKNGSFSQLLRITKRNGKLSVAKRINTIGQNSKVIFEESDSDFPKDEKGQTTWD